MKIQTPLELDYSYLLPDVSPKEMGDWQEKVNQAQMKLMKTTWQQMVTLAHTMLEKKSGPGNDFLGWLEPRKIMPDKQLTKIIDIAEKLRAKTEVMVVVGIGGSYLGARAVIEALARPGEREVWYAGQTLSADYTAQLLKKLEKKSFCINVISKSGTITEPGIAFRLLRELLVKKVGPKKAKKLIVATTDPTKGALLEMAKKEGYSTLRIPANVGGRYSVFTAVGILPIAFAGIDVKELIEGAANCAEACKDPVLENNPAYSYAAARNLLYNKGKGIELLASFEPRLHYLAEWWKQLFGESEGKNLMGIFPASVEFTTDLHSMGQWIQQGRRDIFETFINISDGLINMSDGLKPVSIPTDHDNNDQLNYLTVLDVAEVNRRAFKGTVLAHREGGVPSMTINLPELTPATLGTLLYFFQKACAISGYLLGVNPFDQEGVESYKKNMFALLKKPGFEKESATVIDAVDANIGKHVIKFS